MTKQLKAKKAVKPAKVPKWRSELNSLERGFNSKMDGLRSTIEELRTELQLCRMADAELTRRIAALVTSLHKCSDAPEVKPPLGPAKRADTTCSKAHTYVNGIDTADHAHSAPCAHKNRSEQSTDDRMQGITFCFDCGQPCSTHLIDSDFVVDSFHSTGRRAEGDLKQIVVAGRFDADIVQGPLLVHVLGGAAYRLRDAHKVHITVTEVIE
jgi:hypothetical protein